MSWVNKLDNCDWSWLQSRDNSQGITFF